MANNFYQINNEILKLDPYNEKDLEKIQFNHYLCRKENLQRTRGELDRGLFKLSYTTIIADTGLSRRKAQRFIQWFVDKGIIECIKKSQVKGEESIFAYTSVYYLENKKSDTNNDTDCDTNNDTNLSSNFNGLGHISDTNSDTDCDTNSDTSKKEKEKENEKEKKNNIYSISSLAFTKIFDLWNSKDIVKHKNITENMVKAYDKISGSYGNSEIVEAIENYNKCLKDDSFYYTHRFTLEKFLKQANGISNFVNDGEVYINYLNQVNKVSVDKVIDEKYKDTCMYKGYKVKAKLYPRNRINYYDFSNEYIDTDDGTYEIPESEVKRVQSILNKKDSSEKYTRGVKMV